uniref:hypothetical protein n=1 Tax=Streptomyces sp. SID7805 TaxID=2690328 RepID=UPI001F046E39|nr:hypothetical protein [Streptomyces sp. SID7805]
MAGARVRLPGEVADAEVAEVLQQLVDQGQALVARVLFADGEVDGQSARDAGEVVGGVDLAEGAYPVEGQPGAEGEAAVLVGQVAVHLGRVAGEPFEAGAVGEGVVEGAEGTGEEAGEVAAAVRGDLGLQLGGGRVDLHAGQGAEDAGEEQTGQVGAVLLRVVPGEHRAHAVAEENQGDTGVGGGRPVADALEVADDRPPGVLAHHPAAAGGRGGGAVAAVVGGQDGIAVTGQEAGEPVVAPAVFRGAVGDLDEGAGVAGLREPGVRGDAGAVRGLVEVLLHGVVS